MVFQQYSLLPWLSVYQNVYEAVAAVQTDMDKAARQRLVRDSLERVGLAAHMHKKPSQLSGGMRQRVAIARAFAVHPRLLLLDEPFVSLDAHLVAGVQRVFLDLVRDTRPTAILVTHLPEDAAKIADRAIVLDGRPARIAADIELTPAPDSRSAEQIRALALALSNYDEATT